LRGLLAAAVLYCAVSFAQTEAPSDRDASDARMALESFLANVDSLTATFTQETWNADQELIETETAVGRFALARPGRVVLR
jgi:outer membrane lipoprotein-sorting protein